MRKIITSAIGIIAISITTLGQTKTGVLSNSDQVSSQKKIECFKNDIRNAVLLNQKKNTLKSTAFSDDFVNKQRLDNYLNKEYIDSSNNWIFYSNRNFSYDTVGSLTHYSTDNWDKATSDWIPSELFDEFIFDNNGNITQTTKFIWDNINNQWQNKYKIDYRFDDYGNQDLIIKAYWDLTNEIWIFFSKQEFILNSEGLIEEQKGYEWDQDSSKWDYSHIGEYIYDNNGNMQQLTITGFFNADRLWLRYIKVEYSYDLMENPNQEIYYLWNNKTNSWYKELKYIYSYDLSYNLSDLILPPLYLLAPDNSNQISNRPLTHNVYEYKNENWINLEEWTAQYSTQSFPSSIVLNDILINIYPNPANDFILIDIDNLQGTIVFELFNINGTKLIYKEISENNRIPINSLEVGIYPYKLKLNDQIYIGKIAVD